MCMTAFPLKTTTNPHWSFVRTRSNRRDGISRVRWGSPITSLRWLTTRSVAGPMKKFELGLNMLTNKAVRY